MRSVRERALVMHFPVHTPEAKGEKSIAARASRILFFLYLFFVLLGTSNPYRDRVAHAEDIITSNPVNQVVYSVLPFLSLLCLPPMLTENRSTTNPTVRAGRPIADRRRDGYGRQHIGYRKRHCSQGTRPGGVGRGIPITVARTCATSAN